MKRKLNYRNIILLCLPFVLILALIVSFWPKEKPVEETSKTTTESKESNSFEPTLERLLKVSMEPVGTTMYVWGGGWNEEDTGAGKEAVTMGVSKRWKEFFLEQDEYYNYEDTLYQIHDGLDCSGYVGWVIYNALNTESGNEGYVMLSGEMVDTYASYGWGTKTSSQDVVDYLPGDIMANDGHVYIVLGQCEDGSVLLVHSSPNGVRVCGTDNFGTGSSQAIECAQELMSTRFPEWFEKYPSCSVDSSYLYYYDQFRWSDSFFKDAASIQSSSVEEILDMI